MLYKRLMTAAAVTLAAGAAAQAGPFDMLFGSRPRPTGPDTAARIDLQDKSQIGRFVAPSDFRPAAPPRAAYKPVQQPIDNRTADRRATDQSRLDVQPVNYQPTLQPIPESYPAGPSSSIPPSYSGPSYGTPTYSDPGYSGPSSSNYAPSPVPYQSYSPGGMGYQGGVEYPAGGPLPIGPDGGVPLYTNIKIDDPDNIAPCAVPKIVQVLDPCPRNDGCGSCGPQCVFVQIFVPPGQCERVSVSRNGHKVKYKYDDYQVEVESKKGYIEVDYDD